MRDFMSKIKNIFVVENLSGSVGTNKKFFWWTFSFPNLLNENDPQPSFSPTQNHAQKAPTPPLHLPNKLHLRHLTKQQITPRNPDIRIVAFDTWKSSFTFCTATLLQCHFRRFLAEKELAVLKYEKLGY